MIDKALFESAPALGIIGGTFCIIAFFAWRIMQVVADMKKNRPIQPLAMNGTAGKMIEIFNQQTTLLGRQTEILCRIEEATVKNGERLERIDGNLNIAMERQKVVAQDVKEMKHRRTG